MANNITLNAAVGTFIANTEEAGGVHTQMVKLTSGIGVQGYEAADAAATDAVFPVRIGLKAIAHAATATAVAGADVSHWYCNREGLPFVMGGSNTATTFDFATTGACTDIALVTIGSGAKIVVTQAQVLCANANTAFPQVRIGFGTANTPSGAGVVLSHPGVPAGGGVSRGDGSGILGIGADNEDLRITSDAPTGGSLRVVCTYYTTAS